MARYSIGDKVFVRSDLTLGSFYMEDGVHKDSVVEDMLQYRGQYLTIEAYAMDKYKVEENRWLWTDEMFCNDTLIDVSDEEFDAFLKEIVCA